MRKQEERAGKQGGGGGAGGNALGVHTGCWSPTRKDSGGSAGMERGWVPGGTSLVIPPPVHTQTYT